MSDAFVPIWAYIWTLDFAGLVCGVAGTLLLAMKGRSAGWGFVAYLASNVAWMSFAYEHALTKLLAQHAIFAVSSLIGVWMWLIRPQLSNSPTGKIMSDGITTSEVIGDRHSGLVGVAYSTDAELLRQCAASGQVPASAIVEHGLQAELEPVLRLSDETRSRNPGVKEASHD